MEKKKPKVIILESNDAVREHAASILTKEGWDVTCEKVSQDALNTLEHTKNTLFALFISNFKLPKMEGDDILQKVKTISPLTQRMLLVPADKVDTLINAVNKAEINACITSPFNDEALIYQARNCFKQFMHTLKRQQLKRVTVHQNKQMFKIAQKLKKKDVTYKNIIEEKKAQKLMLKSKKREIETQHHLTADITLSSLMGQRELHPSPDAFKEAFTALCKTVKDLFDEVAARNHMEQPIYDLKKILKSEDPLEVTIDTAENAIRSELQKKIQKEAYARTLKTAVQNANIPHAAENIPAGKTAFTLDEYFDISISENQTKAFITKLKNFEGGVPKTFLADLLDMLREKQILYGILDDNAIETWVSKSLVDKIIIAKGEEPVYGCNGEIKYHFKTDFSNPGKISEDGSIDFRDRGDIPYVRKGDLLAQKTLPKEGKPGINVSGTPIPVDEAIDPVFTAGSGTEPSEDGLSIHASNDGQPHLDALGTISVNPELVIPGDVDFETGNIDFKGNIVVKGMIKEGFTVKGINLTVKEIEGAVIDLSGDLNVSAGITDSTIACHGTIYAKFINHSTVKGFGNLVISKEIIDTSILLSGSCQNPAGHIISSQITARRGIEAGKIGTPSSKPAKLKVGVDDHIETLKTQIDEKLENSVRKAGLLKDEIKKLEDQDQDLYQKISEKAHTQDRAQLEIKELKKSLPEIEKSNDTLRLQEVSKGIKKLMERAKVAEQELNTIFETQDTIANEIERIKNQISMIEEKNKASVIEKKALTEFLKKDPPLATVTVAKSIIQDSVVKGPHTSLILKEDRSKCRIQELSSQQDDIQFYEMIVSDL